MSTQERRFSSHLAQQHVKVRREGRCIELVAGITRWTGSLFGTISGHRYASKVCWSESGKSEMRTPHLIARTINPTVSCPAARECGRQNVPSCICWNGAAERRFLTVNNAVFESPERGQAKHH